MLEVTYNGRVFVAENAEGLVAMGVPTTQIDAAVATKEALQARQSVRNQIAQSAGDTLSVLGTTSDGAQLLLFHLAKMSGALSAANSLAEVREAVAPFAALTTDFLSKVESGEVKLPFRLKGEATVMTEIETRATAVSDALIQAQKGG